MKIYNTLTRQKEEFVPITPGKVKIYACGPTVYNFIHIGNARPICVFDTLRRYLEYRGYDVKFVQNFTDIDDKLITRARQEDVTVPEIAARFIEEYETDARGLGVRPADVHPKATESIDTIIKVVATLVEKGFAYEIDGDVYFRSRKFEDYGKLSQMQLDELDVGARVEAADIKEDPLDFVLWKSAKPSEPFWPSPWGDGRPGWHIECTAMIENHLGLPIDIHCGGQDLIFPHHENEIAQGVCYHGGDYAKYWMHNGYINVDNAKMSKSVGNFFTTREVAEKFGYEPIKYMMLSAHYRSPINYSYEVIEQSKAALERLYTCRANLDFALKNAASEATPGEAEFMAAVDGYAAQFVEAMDEDLNTAGALGVLFDMVREINTFIAEPRSAAPIEHVAQRFDELTDVLGILYNRAVPQRLDAEVEELIEKRGQARAAKNFAEADAIRDRLLELGIVLEDTPQGVKWSRK